MLTKEGNITVSSHSLLSFNRLIEEGKLMDALALSDRYLRNGASDHLLQLIIESGEETRSVPVQSHGYGGNSIWSNSWQYCLRLKDKQVAARLALKYVMSWVYNLPCEC